MLLAHHCFVLLFVFILFISYLFICHFLRLLKNLTDLFHFIILHRNRLSRIRVILQIYMLTHITKNLIKIKIYKNLNLPKKNKLIRSTKNNLKLTLENYHFFSFIYKVSSFDQESL